MDEVIYDWNARGHAVSPAMHKVQFHDETLRDGIQSPSVTDPAIDDKIEILRMLAGIGVLEEAHRHGAEHVADAGRLGDVAHQLVHALHPGGRLGAMRRDDQGRCRAVHFG